jgi:MFS transporter, FSR family, fosmidomycin resistance protein
MDSTSTVVQPGQAVIATRVTQGGLLSLLLLSLGHMFVDVYSSALGALQPFLVEQFQLTLTQAGLLGGVLVFSSSVMQPVYGLLSDRWNTKLFAALGPAVSGIFISALGIAPGYGWLLAMVWLGGVGIAMFHPQATARATLGLEAKRARAMAIFVSAGTLGFSLGPTYFSTIATTFGIERTYWAAVPGILVTLLLLALLPDGPAPRRTGGVVDWAPLRAVWRPLTILYFLVVIRSIVQVTYAHFLPLYLSRERGFPVTSANYVLSLYLLGGALGGFAGGYLADRFGSRNVMLFSMLGSVPFLGLFFVAPGWIALAALFLGGLILLFTIPINVVMAQQLVPSQAGTVSALMMGFAWGMAGLLFIPLTGWVADWHSMHLALGSLVFYPVLGFLLTLRLPK